MKKIFNTLSIFVLIALAIGACAPNVSGYACVGTTEAGNAFALKNVGDTKSFDKEIVVCTGKGAWSVNKLTTDDEAPAEAGPSTSPSQPEVSAPVDKCSWLEQNVPQGGDGTELQNYAAKLLGVPADRIRVHIYPCGDGKTVFDGFIVLGPNEGGWSTKVTAHVPDGGAIDSYNDASYSKTPQTIGQNTKRATSGTVTATTMTYWFWLDEAPPVDAESSLPEGCQTTASLADELGWTIYDGKVDAYGGLVVEVTEASKLPDGWIAVTEGKKIDEFVSSRGMKAGFWTVYPPYSCRKVLGYSQ